MLDAELALQILLNSGVSALYFGLTLYYIGKYLVKVVENNTKQLTKIEEVIRKCQK